MIKNINGAKLDLDSKILSTTRSSVSTQIMDSILVPANTLQTGDSIIISFLANLTLVGDAVANYYLYWNTGSTLTGAVQLGYFQTAVATCITFDRHVSVNSSTSLYIPSPTTSILSDYGDLSGTVDLVSGVNLGVDTYFIYAVGMDIPSKLFDSGTSTGYKFTIDI
jgi:hypothetical protein